MQSEKLGGGLEHFIGRVVSEIRGVGPPLAVLAEIPAGEVLVRRPGKIGTR